MEIYIDNYKGFKDTVVSLKEVNFFVGENSTGKTAVLNLMEILSHSNFWVAPDFNSDEIELGYFSEMVSQNGAERKYFSIGSSISGAKMEKGACQYIWMNFSEKDFQPEVSESKFICGDLTVWCSISDKETTYRTKHVENGIVFSEWVRDFKGYGETKKVETKNVPLFGIIRALVEKDIRGIKDSSNGRFTFSGIYNHMYWMAPIRAKAKRWYESYNISYTPEGNHTPILLKRYLNSKSVTSKNFYEALTAFGKDSGLFDDVNVRDDKPETPFSVNVLYGNLNMNIANVGYGVSQVLPLVVEMLRSKSESFALQQPEVHLHPRAQAAFGDLIYKVATKNKNRLIIETHSDYMINRFRYAVSKGKGKISSQVLFFSRDESGIHIDEMPIDAKGQYSVEVPQKFMSFFLEEELKMLEV